MADAAPPAVVEQPAAAQPAPPQPVQAPAKPAAAPEAVEAAPAPVAAPAAPITPVQPSPCVTPLSCKSWVVQLHLCILLRPPASVAKGSSAAAEVVPAGQVGGPGRSRPLLLLCVLYLQAADAPGGPVVTEREAQLAARVTKLEEEVTQERAALRIAENDLTATRDMLNGANAQRDAALAEAAELKATVEAAKAALAATCEVKAQFSARGLL